MKKNPGSRQLHIYKFYSQNYVGLNSLSAEHYKNNNAHI